MEMLQQSPLYNYYVLIKCEKKKRKRNDVKIKMTKDICSVRGRQKPRGSNRGDPKLQLR
jgi:hypothetical protein